VLIKNKQNKKILATQRHERMSFGSLWVLPGGHLESGETIIEGGLRECEE
jgi:8-oxo-dGTP pyrophosphatase MutT (NUDIX family)